MDRPHGHAGAREQGIRPGIHGVVAKILRASRQQLGQSKIQHFDGSRFRHKNIRRLDVSMHDPLFVGRIERIRELNGHFNCTIDGQWTAGQNFVQRLSDQQLHRDESPPGILLDGVDRTYPGVV